MDVSLSDQPRIPLKVAFVDYVLEPDKPGRTGLSDIVWDMASELTNRGHDAHIIASYHTDQYPDSRVTVHNFPTPPIGYRNIIGHFWVLKRAASIARRIRPDIIHAPEYLSTAVFSTLKVPVPLVFTTPGNIFHRLEYGHNYEWHVVQVLKWAARVSARQCSRIIAVSREMKEWWERTGSLPAKTVYIPCGIDPKRFYPIPEARRQLGLPEDKLLFLYAGRFSREKGLSDLLDALALLESELQQSTNAILVGAGSQLNELKQHVYSSRLEKIVTIKPWVRQDELSTWYSAVDALVLPSHSEAFSRTIPEAMSCGTPVIGSRITGTEDHIIDGQNGFLFPARNSQALADLLERVIREPDILRRMRAKTLQYAREEFQWCRVIEQIVRRVYSSMIDF